MGPWIERNRTGEVVEVNERVHTVDAHTDFITPLHFASGNMHSMPDCCYFLYCSCYMFFIVLPSVDLFAMLGPILMS